MLCMFGCSEDGVTVILTIKVHPLEALTAGHPRTTTQERNEGVADGTITSAESR